jgi:MYXO-CTERM domain-containing protein
VNDYVAAKQGAKQPWEVFPYSGWTFKVKGSDMLGGAAWDATTRRVYVAAPGADGPNMQPLVHVFAVAMGSPSGSDGGVSNVDGGADDTTASRGCGCRTTGGADAMSGMLGVLFLARRRRYRASRSGRTRCESRFRVNDHERSSSETRA